MRTAEKISADPFIRAQQQYEEEIAAEREETPEKDQYQQGLETGWDLGFGEGFLLGLEKGMAKAELEMRERFHYHIQELKKLIPRKKCRY